MGFRDSVGSALNKGTQAAGRAAGTVAGSVGSAWNRGTAAAGRAADTAKIKSKLSDAQGRWHEAAAKLGESLYDEVKANPELAAGREDILAEMDALDQEIAETQAELDRISQAGVQAKVDAGRICGECGAELKPGMKFCPGCGAPVPQPSEAVEAAEEEAVEAAEAEAEAEEAVETEEAAEEVAEEAEPAAEEPAAAEETAEEGAEAEEE